MPTASLNPACPTLGANAREVEVHHLAGKARQFTQHAHAPVWWCEEHHEAAAAGTEILPAKAPAPMRSLVDAHRSRSC